MVRITRYENWSFLNFDHILARIYQKFYTILWFCDMLSIIYCNSSYCSAFMHFCASDIGNFLLSCPNTWIICVRLTSSASVKTIRYFEYVNKTSKSLLNIIAQITSYLICDAGGVGYVIYVLFVLPYRTKIRRTKVSKFQLGVENFVRRNILSVENFVQYFNTKVR